MLQPLMMAARFVPEPEMRTESLFGCRDIARMLRRSSVAVCLSNDHLLSKVIIVGLGWHFADNQRHESVVQTDSTATLYPIVYCSLVICIPLNIDGLDYISNSRHPCDSET